MFSSNLHQATVNKVGLTNTHKHILKGKLGNFSHYFIIQLNFRQYLLVKKNSRNANQCSILSRALLRTELNILLFIFFEKYFVCEGGV